MDKKISSGNSVITTGLNAFKAFSESDFNRAAELLLQVLDAEPEDWLARLYLGVCYHKTGQLFACQRALRFVADSCPDADMKGKAVQALEIVDKQMSIGNLQQDLPSAAGAPPAFDLSNIIN